MRDIKDIEARAAYRRSLALKVAPETPNLIREGMTKMADVLDALQAVENEGRGIRCVQAIVTYLRRGDFASAQNVRSIDGDKTRGYPKVEQALTEHLGCRLHLALGCEKCRR